MATVNINRKVTDGYYRYKMPKLLAKVEGRGNGIKTVVVNLGEISKALNRPPLYPLKYMGCELGAQTKVDPKGDRFIINGSHDCEKLQDVLDGFIERYVLCPSCGNPETNLSVLPKKEKINMNCIACGNQCNIPNAHRVSIFILKNPPKKPRKIKQKDQHLEKSLDDKVDKEDESKYLDETKPLKEENEMWKKMSSGKEFEKRQMDIATHLSSITISNDSKKSTTKRLEILTTFIKEKIEKDSSLDHHFNEIQNEISRLNLDDRFIFALSHALFDKELATQIQVYSSALARYTIDDQKQKYFLASIEQIVQEHADLLIPRALFIFKFLYDKDIVDEDVFLEWNNQTKSKYISIDTFTNIKAATARFIEWLKNAEEESSEDVSSDKDDQLSDKGDDSVEVKTENTVQTKTEDPIHDEENEQNSSDIDIDDI